MEQLQRFLKEQRNGSSWPASAFQNHCMKSSPTSKSTNGQWNRAHGNIFDTGQSRRLKKIRVPEGWSYVRVLPDGPSLRPNLG